MHRIFKAIAAAGLLLVGGSSARAQYVTTPNGPAPLQHLAPASHFPGVFGPYGLHRPKVIPSYGPDVFLRPDLGEMASLFYTPEPPKHQGFSRHRGIGQQAPGPGRYDPPYRRRPSNLGFIPVRRGHGYGTGVYRHPSELIRILGKGL